MTTYAKRKLIYSRNENFNLLHYVEWDRFVAPAGSKSGQRVTLLYLIKQLILKKGVVPTELEESTAAHGESK
jgi:hypothetical protein